jgi:Ca2+-binding RTX toxin-like protein
VDFSSGFISGAGNVGQDRVSGMASVRATEFGDQLFGSNDNPSGPSPFTLLGRFESFEGMAGDDLIFGQGGLDRASYSQSPTGVKVDLAAGVATEDGFGGVDTLFGVEGVRGSSFDDMLIGDDNDNFFEPHRGNDMVDGAGGEDLLFFGGLGSGVTVNLLTGVIIHANGDRGTVMNVENLEGGGGFDRLNGDHGDNDIAGGDFNDRLVGRSGADRLFGGEGRDGLFGNSGDDILFGGAGRDGLAGAGGMDVLIGGADRDNLTGGEDSDTFVFAPGSGIDVIRDMEIGVDKIDVSAFGFADFDAVLAATDDVNGRAEIRFSDDGADRVQIDGVVQADLLAGDFIL